LRISRHAKRTNDKTIQYTAFKSYRAFIRHRKKTYNKEINQKLASLAKDHNSKDYWNILKKHRDNNNSGEMPTKALFEHFKSLNDITQEEVNSDRFIHNDEGTNDFINQPFSIEELIAAIKNIKNNKASGPDNIYPEFLKAMPNNVIQMLTNFLNLVLSSGNVPEEWALSIINPIHKKGPHSDSNNYRGISLLNASAKLFTALINRRLTDYLEATGS
jgi:hypothetical protein